MRLKTLAIAVGLLGLAGCSHCGGGCGLWNKLCGRKTECSGGAMAAPMSYAGMPGAAGSDCGCGTPAVAEEAILTAPQKLMAEPRKDAPGYAEPMPFTPKK